MAEVAAEVPESTVEGENMEVEDTNTNNSKGDGKRAREEEANGTDSETDAANKKQKVDISAEEKRLEDAEKAGDDVEKSGPVSLGPKTFETSVQIFNYLHKFVHFWPLNFDVNKYEHMILLDLLKKGHSEPDKKIGSGIRSFQIRQHPMWKSRCFFIVREDESVDDFSFRKCVDCILPLPEEMKVHPAANRALGGHGGRGGGHGGRERKINAAAGGGGAMINHYEVLGFPSDTTSTKLTRNDITKAYRSKALELHPDKCPNDPDASTKFQTLQNSYKILIDPDTRKIVDSYILRKHEERQQLGDDAYERAERIRKWLEYERLKEAFMWKLVNKNT